MKLTLITATFNSERNIFDCLNSVSSQTYSNIEHIIVDGGSSDKTVAIIKSVSTFSKIISEPDQGIYDALNKGINLATGDIIGFLHSDDLLDDSNIIVDIVERFINTNVDGVYGDLLYVNKDNTNKTIRHWKSKAFQQRNLIYGWMPAHPTLFLKKKIYEKHGLFDLSFKIAADYDFMLRILKDSELKFEYLPKVITKMRVGGASNKNLSNILKKSREDLRAMRKNNIGGFHTLIFKNLRKLGQFF